MSLDVGQIAALINIATLIVVSLAERGFEVIVHNFSVLRLSSVGKGPIIHDSDTWLPNIPRSIFKFYRYPGMSQLFFQFY